MTLRSDLHTPETDEDEMEDLKKVNSLQLYQMWKNLAISILCLIALVAFTRMLPFYLAPAVALGVAAVLYTMIYQNKQNRLNSCIITTYCLFYCVLTYSFVAIVLNVMYAWGLIVLPDEIVFFNRPYIPALLLAPISVVVLIVLYFRRQSLHVCVDCRLHNGDRHDRGLLGQILHHESALQLKNLMGVFAVIGTVDWIYYLFMYVKIDLNNRDWYIFAWFFIIVFLLDEIYFVFRYYNLYLDLKEGNELMDPEAIENMEAKTYLRFYVICGNHIFVDPKSIDPATPYREVIDTPFITRRSMSGIRVDEVRRIVERMTGEAGGELRFFFGRKSPDLSNATLLRYFYFLDGDIHDYPELNVEGEWMDFERIKQIYAKAPGQMSHRALSDLTRLATIIQTEKTFDEKGYRKHRIKSYTPGFSLKDVRRSALDFQDDKWLHISIFNSDTPFYGIKRWWRNVNGKGVHKPNSEWSKQGRRNVE